MEVSREVVLQQVREFAEDSKKDKSKLDSVLELLYNEQLATNIFQEGYFRTSSKIEGQEGNIPMDVDFFKYFDMRSLGGSCEADEATWKSSGTTSGESSETGLKSLEFYDRAIDICKTGTDFEKRLSKVSTVLNLVPKSFEWPNSSLAYMFDRLSEGKSVIQGVQVHGDKPGDLVLDPNLANLSWVDAPIGIFTTSYMGIQLMESLRENVRLPSGSFIVDTGGYKGVVRDYSRGEFKTLVKQRLGLDDKDMFSEYGMSELSSHMWSEHHGEKEVWRIPETMKVTILSPNEEGIGRVAIEDVLNVWTTCSILTGDLGRLVELDGEQFFIPEGRAKGAPMKGCSITAERAFGE